MFGFKLWAGFGVFRDPLTITQNMTFSIPPKTTIGGMLAAVLGIDYQDYFDDPEFFNFGYSLILLNPVRKKSFSQNYIEDYTKKKSPGRLNAMLKIRDEQQTLHNYISQRDNLVSTEDISEKDRKKIVGLGKKIQTSQAKLEKAVEDLSKKTVERFAKAKPIFRELLINPAFLVFIQGFKYETEIISRMKNHGSAYPLYMGNSEFAANYSFIACIAQETKALDKLDSFTGSPDKIEYEAGKKYTSIYAATRTMGDRSYRDFRHVVVCDKIISLKSPVGGCEVTTESGSFRCDFI